jgi:hypothetical protein
VNPVASQARIDAQTDLDRLQAEEDQLSRDLTSATDPSTRAAIFARGGEVMEQQATVRPATGGRRTDIARFQKSCRHHARMCRSAARVETARASLAERGWNLPDPATVIKDAGSESAVDFFADLYEAVARRASDPHAVTQ